MDSIKISCIYTITCLVDNKMYVGRTKDWEKRRTNHMYRLKVGTHPNTHLQNAYNLHGGENFIPEILEEYPNEGFILPSMEHYWAGLLNVHDRKFGYNIVPTDPYGRVNTPEEVKKKISKANKGKKRTEEQNRIMGLKRRGKKLSEKHKANMSKSLKGKMKGRILSKEHFDKLQEGNRNKIVTEETKRKQGDAVKNRLTFKEDMETLHKLRQIEVVQLTKDYQFVKEWESAAHVEKVLPIFATSISKVIREKKGSTGGFFWMSKKDYQTFKKP